jgi:CheY-like chemotaxis protein
MDGETEVSGGAQALGVLREPPFPDVILLDLIMPGVDGLTVLSELRKERQIRNLPVAVLSDTGGPLGARLAASLGADDYVTKPFDPATLLSRCAALAGRAQADAGVAWQLPDAQLEAS